MPTLTTFLTFNDQAEEAVRHYLSIFESGKIHRVVPGPGGKALTVDFELFGQRMVALNGGPTFVFSQAFSLLVTCDTQAEIDRYWAKLTADGGKEVQCGWLTDKFGVSWQIVPKALMEFIGSKDQAKAGRAMQAMMKMQKLDIAELQRAYDGN
ncbi:MAG: VOC family protein [Polyangiaceae bacterium]|nr:VOC family protein [Polyangiaceae bacterium]